MTGRLDGFMIGARGDLAKAASRRFQTLCRCLAVTLVVGVAACTAGQVSPEVSPIAVPTPDVSPIAVPTQPPSPSGSPTGCMTSHLEGRLTQDDRWGIALQDEAGLAWKIIWPWGYFAQRSIGGLALVDVSGRVVARTGDLLSVGGSEFGRSGTWIACGDLRHLDG